AASPCSRVDYGAREPIGDPKPPTEGFEGHPWVRAVSVVESVDHLHRPTHCAIYHLLSDQHATYRGEPVGRRLVRAKIKARTSDKGNGGERESVRTTLDQRAQPARRLGRCQGNRPRASAQRRIGIEHAPAADRG